MARDEEVKKDYFVEEVCIVQPDEHRDPFPVVPVRFFERNDKIWATAHPVIFSEHHGTWIIDGRQPACLEIPLSCFFLNVLDLQEEICRARFGLPELQEIKCKFY